MRVTVRRGGGERRKAGKKGVGETASEMEPAQTGDDAGTGAASFRGWERAQLPCASSLSAGGGGEGGGRYQQARAGCGALWGRDHLRPPFSASSRGRDGAGKPHARKRDKPPSVGLAMPEKMGRERSYGTRRPQGSGQDRSRTGARGRAKCRGGNRVPGRRG